MPVGTMLGKCRIVMRIGRGGMGDVYLADHTALKRQVAIKILPPQLTRDPEALARFEREAIAAGRLDHPNVVRFLDLGEQGALQFIVLEYVAGRSLQKVLDGASGAMELKEAARIVAAAARGLQSAHEAGIVHRDVKPGNILIGARGEVKITDFGTARVQGGPSVTSVGDAVGTPEYMSPEQAQGKEVGPAGDIYSLGVTLYACVTGVRPFTADNPMAVLYKQIHEEPLAPRRLNPDISEPFSRLILRMMSKVPAMRHATAAEVEYDLESYIKGALRSVSGMKADSQILRARAKVQAAQAKVAVTKAKHLWTLVIVLAIFVPAVVGLLVWALSGSPREARPRPSASSTK